MAHERLAALQAEVRASQDAARRAEREAAKAHAAKDAEAREALRLVKQLDDGTLEARKLRAQVDALQKEADCAVREEVVAAAAAAANRRRRPSS